MIKNVAVILAAGKSSRADFSKPKQLIKLCGRLIIDHTLDRFQESSVIDEIAMVTNAECIGDIESLVSRRQAGKVKKILLGGRERYESSLAAINAYESESNSSEIRLIFHDAVRPLVSDRIISDVVAALDHYRAVDVTIPATDTVVVADTDTDTMREIPDRRFMHLGQTPQAFAYETIKRAYELALKDPAFRTTDDCGVVLKYLPGEKIYLVRGALNNVKLTFADDLLVLDKFMQSNAGRRLNAVSDTIMLSSLRGKSLVVFGGSSGIGASMVRLARAFGAEVHVASRSNNVDVGAADAVDDYLKEVMRTSQRIDAIINTAAVLNRQPMINMSTKEVLESINTNFLGAINVARFGFEYLKATKGHLMFFTSSSYTYGRAYYSIYSSSKAAVVNLTQALADEWVGFGIRVNCISPERTRTPMRVKAFGVEAPEDLLDPDLVARKALGVLVGSSTGFIYDISRT
jgi:ribitol-5-phosphate 2-dehydrogenase (NADP+) / D-ribitol-5-phosphate cytidylyltransferase